MATDTASKALTETTWTLTTSIENYWMMASANTSSSYSFIDCGCTTHISGCQAMFITYTEYPPNTKKVKGYNGVTLFASRYGSVRLICQLPDGTTETIIHQEVVHLPVSFYLISESQIMNKDVKVKPLNHYGLNLYNRDGKLIATAPQVDGLCILDRVLDWAPPSTEYTDIDNSNRCLLVFKTPGHISQHDAEKLMLWHHCIAHVHFKALKTLPTNTDAPGMTGKCDCESCIKCKLVWNPISPVTSRATEPLQLVHSDICGTLETAIRGGRYMLLFINNPTWHTDEYILKFKSEALEEFKEWKTLREKELGKQVKRFWTDAGCEYTSKKFGEYIKSEGILKATTTPYTPQSNLVGKWANHTIMEHIQCMLDDAGLLKKYQVFAVSVAVYLKNHTPMWSVVSNTAYEAWHGTKPFLNHLRVCRCLAFVHLPEEKRKKLDYRATPGIFFGYCISTTRYFVYKPLAKTLHQSRDVVFREGKRYIAPNAADPSILNEHFCRDVIEESNPTEMQPTRDETSKCQTEESLDNDSPPDPPKPKKKSRELAGFQTSLGEGWKPPAEGSRPNGAGKLAQSAQLALNNEEFEDMIPIYMAAAISNDHEDGIDDPKSYKAATESLLAEKWDMVMKQALDAIDTPHVIGDFVELPEGRKALPSLWVYKMKHEGVGNVQRLKARPGCGGNHQIDSIAYLARYALTARLRPVRLALPIATKYDLEI